ncbi:hypothetical protein H6P81_012246 [Aristolochia fimbriata]|uniref:Uncharacterized protein n=1 Tax=Aristolochia fimbriata TaxID=158543 RepID=A0AAV7EFW3_ARIFI|nr:hypothetical protein H6P81_012246 [Aristolochia fimbriata]
MASFKVFLCFVLTLTLVLDTESRRLLESKKKITEAEQILEDAKAALAKRGPRATRPVHSFYYYDSKRISPGGPDARHHTKPTS